MSTLLIRNTSMQKAKRVLFDLFLASVMLLFLCACRSTEATDLAKIAPSESERVVSSSLPSMIPGSSSTGSNSLNAVQPGGPRITNISDNRGDPPGDPIPQYSKFEITFDVENTLAGNFQLPYDPNPPAGIDPERYSKYNGISVDAQFTPDGWRTVYQQPAFFYQHFEEAVKPNQNGTDREWFYPTDQFSWKVRFAPNQPGTWEYKLVARDAGGTTESKSHSLDVVPSTSKGLIRVSEADFALF